MKCKNQNALVVALEQLGDSEYKRADKDGYEAARFALTRAAEIRESEATPQKDKLKRTYRLLGFAYLSLGLQVVRSTEYFEKAKVIMLEESSDSSELAEINFYIGLLNYWRGLRGTGRWGEKDETLLSDLNNDPFVFANIHFGEAIEIRTKLNGRIHPETLNVYHYLQEASYSLGLYNLAIPWLKKYVSVLPYKDIFHTDNYYVYSLIVSLEEHAKQIALTDSQKALTLIQDAFQYIQSYDEGGEIGHRLENVLKQIEAGKIEEPVYPKIDELTPLETETRYKGVWSKWQYSGELQGFQTNNWMVAANGVWFFNGEKKQLVFWDQEKSTLSTSHPAHWPEGCGRMVFDQNNRIFYAWSSIRSTVFELTSPDGNWTRLSFGVHDVHACGASYAFDPINNRLFEFGGYGYFTYKNWLWVYDISERKWIQLKENKPGISPYPRNGQLLPIENGNKALLISGIGSDTGIQREHKARLGLASATDVGYFTWLRDAHELDLATMEWKRVMSANHNTIRHEGSMGLISNLNLVVNWGGTIPSPEFGKEAVNCEQCSCVVLSENTDFKNLEFKGVYPPSSGGYFQMIPGLPALLFIHQDGIWKFDVS